MPAPPLGAALLKADDEDFPWWPAAAAFRRNQLPRRAAVCGESGRLPYDGRVEIYFVRCRSCDQEIEIDRKPRGENLATAFSSTWTRELNCACGATGGYSRSDIQTRHEPSAGTP
jgi:hypothetical protein